jgi:hypothetical protein
LLTPLFQPEWHFCGGQFLSTGRTNISQLAPGQVASLEAERRAEPKELWLELCERAANEQNADQLLAMVLDINAVLELKIGRLKQAGPELVRNASELTPRILCSDPVPLDNGKTDEDGKAVHEECYLLSMRLKRATSNDKDVHA